MWKTFVLAIALAASVAPALAQCPDPTVPATAVPIPGQMTANPPAGPLVPPVDPSFSPPGAAPMPGAIPIPPPAIPYDCAGGPPPPPPPPPPTPPPPPPGGTTVTMGETTVFSDIDGGNSNLLLAQDAVLSQDGTLQSLSFYAAAVAGNLVLAVYDSSGPGGGPGNLLAQTAIFTPLLGWNTQQTLPVKLTAGAYWLAYAPSDDFLSFPAYRNYGQFVGQNTPFGVAPAMFPTIGLNGNVHWSFYATLSVP